MFEFKLDCVGQTNIFRILIIQENYCKIYLLLMCYVASFSTFDPAWYC